MHDVFSVRVGRQTLQQHGERLEVGHHAVGSHVTQYALKAAEHRQTLVRRRRVVERDDVTVRALDLQQVRYVRRLSDDIGDLRRFYSVCCRLLLLMLLLLVMVLLLFSFSDVTRW